MNGESDILDLSTQPGCFPHGHQQLSFQSPGFVSETSGTHLCLCDTVNLLSLGTDGRKGGCMRHEILQQVMRCEEGGAVIWMGEHSGIIRRFGSV